MIDLAHRIINEDVVQTPEVTNILGTKEKLPEPLHPLAPPPQETFSIAPQENTLPEAQTTSIAEPPKTPIDETNTPVSTIALETNDSATNRADTEETDFIKGVENAHKTETITAL